MSQKEDRTGQIDCQKGCDSAHIYLIDNSQTDSLGDPGLASPLVLLKPDEQLVIDGQALRIERVTSARGTVSNHGLSIIQEQQGYLWSPEYGC